MVDFPLVENNIPLLEATDLEDLLIYLKQCKQVDLMGYKRPSLLRRIRARMQQVGIARYQNYLAHLKLQPDEVALLLNTIFINVTSFFRDRLVWDYLKNQVIPQILAKKASNEPIRIWSAGCASGEEAYSLAMLLVEALGLEQFQQRVQIYATDVDGDAVMQAQKGCYSSAAVEEIPPNLLERYFEPTADGYRWRLDLCSLIIFHPHNLIQAPALLHIDLLLCRNMLIYLTLEAQLHVLGGFKSSLGENGFLLLGQAENLVTIPQKLLFTSINRQIRVYKKATAKKVIVKKVKPPQTKAKNA